MTGSEFDSRGALEAVDRILNRGGEPDGVLRDVLDALHARGVPFARITLLGDPAAPITVGAGEATADAPIAFRGTPLGTLEIATDDRKFVLRLATLVSAVSAESAKHFRRT